MLNLIARHNKDIIHHSGDLLGLGELGEGLSLVMLSLLNRGEVSHSELSCACGGMATCVCAPTSPTVRGTCGVAAPFTARK